MQEVSLILVAITAAFIATSVMWGLGILERSNVWVAMVVTWLCWLMFWRSEIVLPLVLAGNSLSPVLTSWDPMGPWLWTYAYGVAFYVAFNVMGETKDNSEAVAEDSATDATTQKD